MWDLDKVVNFEKKTRAIKEFVEIDKVSKHIYNNKYRDEKLTSFIDNEDFLNFAKLLESKNNTFIWGHGAIEDAILSSINCNEEIRKSLNCKKKFDSTALKNKLKERLHEGERKKFYDELIKINEIDRFLHFLKENEENHGNPKKYEWNHLKSLKYNCYIMNVLIILVIKLLLFGVLIHRITEK